ncbi:RNA ligase family protein [Devosia soli]|uniref:ATP-dependent DNA ligase n=1 Tax=Devosia soli TaxID=361041 RepID=UPI001FCD02D5|nr:RNA ligase family protein [Devosia soli]
MSETIPTGDDWLFEMKFDGYRAQVAISGSEVRVYTRNGHDWTEQFKVILPRLKTVTKGSALLDGEIVAIDNHGRNNFSMLKTGIAAGIPLKFYAFDIFEKDGEDLTRMPLIERKAILQELIGDRDAGDSLQYSYHVIDGGESLFDTMCKGGHEGVIAKRVDGRYVGDRTKGWLKIKCTKRQEFVIGGWRPSDNGRGMAKLPIGRHHRTARRHDAGSAVYGPRRRRGRTPSLGAFRRRAVRLRSGCDQAGRGERSAGTPGRAEAVGRFQADG